MVAKEESSGAQGQTFGGICHVHLFAKSPSMRDKQLRGLPSALENDGWCTGSRLVYLLGDLQFMECEADHWGFRDGSFKASGGVSSGSKKDGWSLQQLSRDGLEFGEVFKPDHSCRGTNHSV